MQAPSGSTDKGKQRAREPEEATQSIVDEALPPSGDAASSRVLEPMPIPSRVVPGGVSDLSQSPSSSSGHERRRPSHARAKSSLGSANMFDFFGPSSLASTSTGATSFHFGSPGGSPKPGAAQQEMESEEDDDLDQRGSLERTVDAKGSRVCPAQPRVQETPEIASLAVNAISVQLTAPDELNERSLGSNTAPMPPLYPEESLPHYEEAPEYTPPLSQPSASGSRSKTSAFRAAAANRFLSSRIARKLNLPPALQSRLQGTQTPDAASVSQGYAAQVGTSDGRTRFVRSDSAPNLLQSRHPQGPRRIEVRNYAATAYMSGARMGPAPRNARPSSSRPSAAGADSVRSRSGAAAATRPSTGTDATGRDSSRAAASPLPRTAVSSVGSSRRNSSESRPASRATTRSAPNGGLFTCGYGSGRSGATTPTRSSLLRKSRSRKVSLKSLGDLLSLNRDRDNTPSDNDSNRHQQQVDDQPSTGAILREVVSPVSQELLISARVRAAPTARPTLMNAAHSSPQAGVDAAAAGSPVLISPHQSYERKPDPLQKLPRELILTIFQSLVDLHVQEHTKVVKDGSWRGKRSSETRWVGAEAAVRELARLSRVSRAWQSYVLDGQLWQTLEFSKHPEMTEQAMIDIAKAAGPFVRRLDLQGLANLQPRILIALVKLQHPRPLTARSLATPGCVPSATRQLEELNLQGCRQLTTHALNKVLSLSPNLKHCKLASLPCVDNTTLCVLAATATHLETLDISRCRSIDAEGVQAFFAIQESETNHAAVSKERNAGSCFRELRAAGVPAFDRGTLSLLGRHWPNLEVLDLSYCSAVTDAAIAALVSSDGDVVNEKGHFVTLTPRQAGSPYDDEVVRRRFPHLKKLHLSSCRALTDRACVSLAHAVPALEVLEMANIGPAIKDAGLIKLLSTIPRLQKLDLERATQITDAVVSALTPPESHAEAFGLAVPDRDTLMNGTRPRGSLLNMARRSASRRRQENSSASAAASREEAPPRYDEEAVAALIPATGTHLTHLIVSSANRVSAEALLLLIHRCPFLVHLEVDDTHADNEVALQFVQLARFRKVRNAYLSLIDCRSFSRDTYSQLSHSDAADGGVRPRQGSRGYAFRQFSYDDAEPCTPVAATNAVTGEGDLHTRAGHTHLAVPAVPATNERSSMEGRDHQARDRGYDECNELKPVVKSFWGWQLVDARMKQKRKAEQRAAAAHRRQGGRGKVTSVVAMALGLPSAATASAEAATSTAAVQTRGQRGGHGHGQRWSRMLLGPEAARDEVSTTRNNMDGEDHDDDDDDDARGCTVM